MEHDGFFPPDLPDEAYASEFGDDNSFAPTKTENHRYGAAQFTRPKATPFFKFVAAGNLEYREPEFLVEGLIETETLGMLFGDPACGKSFLAVDLALSIATGTAFHGRNVKQGVVFLIAGEGHNGLARRFAAWSKHHGVSLIGAPLFKSERAAQFLDGESATAVATSVDALAEENGTPALIIVDTVARNFGGGDENSTSDMGAFIAAIDALKARYPGCVVLLVHHSGHADKSRARGATALKGALDCEFCVKKRGTTISLTNTKMKDAEPPTDLFFKLTNVALTGTAESAVLASTEAPERKTHLTASQRLALDTYTSAAAEHGIWEDGTFRGLHVDAWRDAFYRKHTGDTPDSKRKAFQRVRSALLEKGQILATHDIYLAKDADIQMAILLHRDMAGHLDKCPAAEVGPAGTSGTNA